MEEGIIGGLYPESCMMISAAEEARLARIAKAAKIEKRLAMRAHLGQDDLAVQSMTAELKKIQSRA